MAKISQEICRHLKPIPVKAMVVEDWYYIYVCQVSEGNYEKLDSEGRQRTEPYPPATLLFQRF